MPPCHRPTQPAPSAISRALNAQAALNALVPGSDALTEFNEFRQAVWSLLDGEDPFPYIHAWHLLTVVCQRYVGELACGDIGALDRLKESAGLVVQHLP